MNLDNLKLADIQKLKTANAEAKKVNKDAMSKLAAAKKAATAIGQAIKSEAKDLSTTDE